jgi:hypothetical protein
MAEEIEKLKDEEKENEEQTRPTEGRRRGGEWIIGLILVGLGLFFLLGNIFPFEFLNNWWALFIFIPAIANFRNAWQSYHDNGRLTSKGRGSLIGGLLISTVAVILLFSLDWGVVWPVFIIIVGLGALLSALGN